MSTFQQDVRDYLIAVNKASGNNIGEKVHHESIPNGAQLPFMTMTELSSSRAMTLDGKPLFAKTQIQVTVFAYKATEINLIVAQLQAAFETLRGMMGETRVAAVRVELSADEISYQDGDAIVKGKSLNLFFTYY